MQLTINYNIIDGRARSTALLIQVGNFNNPIVTAQGGFNFQMLDAEEFLVSELKDVVLQGITQSA